jgi:hypothetical protein
MLAQGRGHLSCIMVIHKQGGKLLKITGFTIDQDIVSAAEWLIRFNLI